MKLILSAFVVLAAPCFADDVKQPSRISVDLQKVFVPEGFDDNDITQVVVTGEFSDTCHKVGSTAVSVEEGTGKVRFAQSAYKYTDTCQRAVVPFSQVVDVGLLKAGEYELDDATSSTAIGKLTVAAATKAAADDFLYAPVTDANVLRNEVEVRGTFMDRCTKLQNVVVKASGDTIVVQPVVTRYGNVAECPTVRVPFRVRAKLPGGMHRGAYLLHVRSMSGNSVNKLVDVTTRPNAAH